MSYKPDIKSHPSVLYHFYHPKLQFDSWKEKSKRIFYLLTSVVLLCGIVSAAAAGVVLNFKEATAWGGPNLGNAPKIFKIL